MSTVWNSPQAAEVPRVAEDAHSLQERKGWCTIYTAVMAKPTRTMAPGQPKKKMVSVSCKTRNPNEKSLLLRSHIER